MDVCVCVLTGMLPFIDQLNGTTDVECANVVLKSPAPGLPFYALQAIKPIPKGGEIVLW